MIIQQNGNISDSSIFQTELSFDLKDSKKENSFSKSESKKFEDLLQETKTKLDTNKQENLNQFDQFNMLIDEVFNSFVLKIQDQKQMINKAIQEQKKNFIQNQTNLEKNLQQIKKKFQIKQQEKNTLDFQKIKNQILFLCDKNDQNKINLQKYQLQIQKLKMDFQYTFRKNKAKSNQKKTYSKLKENKNVSTFENTNKFSYEQFTKKIDQIRKSNSKFFNKEICFNKNFNQKQIQNVVFSNSFSLIKLNKKTFRKYQLNQELIWTVFITN